MTKSSEAALGLLDELPRYDVKPGLERIDYLLKRLGRPDRDFRSVHIGGSNGKGSVVALLAGVLGRDHRVGEFVSPPLVDFSDRIKVAGEKVDSDSIAAGLEKLEEPVVELRSQGDEPSLFEAVTALAAWYFSREKVDLALLETGLGGKYDATNPVGQALVSVVTSVDLEHENLLGSSLEEIAAELVGLGKPEKPLVVGPTDFPRQVFEEGRREIGFELVQTETRTEVEIMDFDWESTRFRVRNSPFAELENDTLELGLLGTYQKRNLRTALTVLGELEKAGMAIEADEVRKGIRDAKWPGRFQLVENDPHLLLDGAHNRAATELLAREIERYGLLRPQSCRVRLVFSSLKDKNARGMLDSLSTVVDEIYLTELAGPRAAPLKALTTWSNQLGLDFSAISSPGDAIRIARDEAKRDDLICVTGSLYLVREAIISEL